MYSWQVFGLAGRLLAPASQFVPKPVLFTECSFLLTAAGQFRSLTGFPFSLYVDDTETMNEPTLAWVSQKCKHNI